MEALKEKRDSELYTEPLVSCRLEITDGDVTAFQFSALPG